MELNLLPKERASGKDAGRLAALFKKTSIATGGIFLFVTAILGIFYLLSLNSLSNTRAKHEELTLQAQSLQPTEASLVFLKDRLQKSQMVLSSRTNEDVFVRQSQLLANAPEAIAFKESELATANSTIELTTPNSENLTAFLSGVSATSTFNSLILKELSFGLATGYSLLFEVF